MRNGSASPRGLAKRLGWSLALLGCLTLTTVLGGAHGSAQSLGFIDITVTGLRNSNGDIRLAICSTPVCYQNQKGFFKQHAIPASEKGVNFRFDDLPPGPYTVMMFHDENGNNKFDKNLIGWPREGFGFSRNAEPGLGKPSYDEVVLDLGADGITTTLVMQYW